MNLKKYDGKCVQIYYLDGKVYEGICTYNDHDYNFHEYGRNEEALEIFHFLFYKSDIRKISIIDKFTDSFGEIEIETYNDEIGFLEQGLEDENDVHVYRLLCYMETVEITDKIIPLLKNVVKYNNNKKIIEKAKSIIKKYEGK